MFPEIPIFIIYHQSHPLRPHHINNQIINSPNKGPLWLGGWDQSSPDPQFERLALVWLLEKCTRSPAADGVPKGAGVAQRGRLGRKRCPKSGERPWWREAFPTELYCRSFHCRYCSTIYQYIIVYIYISKLCIQYHLIFSAYTSSYFPDSWFVQSLTVTRHHEKSILGSILFWSTSPCWKKTSHMAGIPRWNISPKFDKIRSTVAGE